jgi:hypothetical protein
MSEGSLWGDPSTLKSIRTPKTMLTEQADFLNQTTGGLIRAQVNATQNGANLSFSLSIIAPVLNNYNFTVCMVTHDVNIYPCKIYSSEDNTWQDCENEEELRVRLRTVLSSDKTRRIIEALLSQSRG